jgi:hypothetical protein
MALSAFDPYSVGIGPSSSHTARPGTGTARTRRSCSARRTRTPPPWTPIGPTAGWTRCAPVAACCWAASTGSASTATPTWCSTGAGRCPRTPTAWCSTPSPRTAGCWTSGRTVPWAAVSSWTRPPPAPTVSSRTPPGCASPLSPALNSPSVSPDQVARGLRKMPWPGARILRGSYLCLADFRRGQAGPKWVCQSAGVKGMLPTGYWVPPEAAAAS